VNYGATAHINLAALQHDFRRVQELVPNCKIMAMLKTNAYGHGLLQAAKVLDMANAFGVASPAEAIELRKSDISKPLVVMRGFADAEELQLFAEHNLDAVIHHHDQLVILQQAKLPKKISVWLKIDTGMHRLGFAPKDAAQAYQELKKNPKIKEPIYVMTHFAEAANLSSPTTEKQLSCFAKATQGIRGKGVLSVANSAAIIAWPQSHADWVRPGVMLYGISPFANKVGGEIGLKPVMTLQSKILVIKKLSKGDKIGYGGTYTCPENMPVGIAAIGYGDGYPRHAKNGTPILVNGIECQLVGRVSMDMITIDLRNNPNAKPGDSVILWGDGLPAEYIARSADTIPYELFCRLTKRVKFVYRRGE
jgi:alanine racemase